ncbi:TIGR01777 family oxidoreductase [Neptuniibacter pectenicola]|uniref:TIGR01777 family oxidoreductase n=1 Tax=Neptuniibacter pectenicola TaxID=1806669 RepID=A0ABU9TS51_9GAMM
MNILITGGSGLIGQSFIKQFNNHSFTVLTRSPDKVRAQHPASVKIITSLDNFQNLNAYDAVINLAGEPIINKRWSEKQKKIIKQSRWKMTQDLVDLIASSNSPPKVFISGSAIGVYGNRGGEFLTESSIIKKSDFPTELCMRWETLAKQAEPYTRVVVIRTGIVIAPHGGALVKMLRPFKFCLGGRISNGKQFMSWIHFKDHINAINYLLTTNNLSGPVNLVAPAPEMNREFSQKLANSLNRFAILPLPKSVLKLLLGESSCLLLDSQRVVPEALLKSGFKFQFPLLRSALADALKN